jgi:hypothetical protein
MGYNRALVTVRPPPPTYNAAVTAALLLFAILLFTTNPEFGSRNVAYASFFLTSRPGEIIEPPVTNVISMKRSLTQSGYVCWSLLAVDTSTDRSRVLTDLLVCLNCVLTQFNLNSF